MAEPGNAFGRMGSGAPKAVARATGAGPADDAVLPGIRGVPRTAPAEPAHWAAVG
ncbi:MAG: hypothetical protein QOE89_629 [Pseudonocardiales bacterium]|nr:hypothetical protein [Pseudonocardiales bacterium]